MAMEKTARITIRVQPNASRNEISGIRDGVLHVKIAAPPIKGRANQELVNFLSDILGVSKSRLTIERGLASKTKVIRVDGLTQDEVANQLEEQAQ